MYNEELKRTFYRCFSCGHTESFEGNSIPGGGATSVKKNTTTKPADYLEGYTRDIRGIPADVCKKYQLQVAISDTGDCLLYTSPSPRDGLLSRMPSSA